MGEHSLNEALSTANAAIKRGDKPRARRIVVRVLKAEPENVSAWLVLTRASRNTDQAEYCLKKVLALDPGNRQAHEWLARLHESADAAQSIRRRNRLLLIVGLPLAAISCFCISFVGLSLIGANDTRQADSQSIGLPPHFVSDGSPNDTIMFIVVSSDFTEAQAWELVRYYRGQSHYVHHIDFHCDIKYANRAAHDDFSSQAANDAYEAHALYMYMLDYRGVETLYTPSRPFSSVQASACR